MTKEFNIKSILESIVESGETPFCDNRVLKICEDSLEYIEFLENKLKSQPNNDELLERLKKDLNRVNSKYEKTFNEHSSCFEERKKSNLDDVKYITDVFNYHGGWNLGYWQGAVYAFGCVVDLLEEEKNSD